MIFGICSAALAPGHARSVGLSGLVLQAFVELESMPFQGAL